MSIHAQPSSEALQNLLKQQRNSTISSIGLAALVVALIALILGAFLLPDIAEEPPVIVTCASELGEDTKFVERKVKARVQRKPSLPSSSPSSSMAKVIAAQTTTTISIPVPDVAINAPSPDFGDGDDFGSAWGEGSDLSGGSEGNGASGGSGGSDDASGGEFADIPASLQKRCTKAERMARLLEKGGTAECEEAVVKALNWLQSTQNPDGSWDDTHPVAMTGFALLAYLGHCETPQSPEYGETVLKAITYLVNNGMKNDGRLTNKDAKDGQWVYDHGIATYALAEAYTFCSKLKINIPYLDKVTKMGGDLIMEGQSDCGGWFYGFTSQNIGDNSVGFWQIQALKACKHTGLWPTDSFTEPSRKALDWLVRAQGLDGAIGYREDPRKSPGLTGGGVLAFQLWDRGSSREAERGIDYIAKNSKFKWGRKSTSLYYHYYNAQAMINHGGKEWDKYNSRFRDELITAQNADGSWGSGVGGVHGAINNHMGTCLATLMLEVYYRFLPGTGGK